MTKEFESIQQTISNKKMELETQARQKKEKELEDQRKFEEQRRIKKEEFERKANDNRRIFENAGVVRLFQEIIDSKIVTCSGNPLMSKGYSTKSGLFGTRDKWVESQQILPYTPAKIEWSNIQYLDNDNTKVSLLFNEKYVSGGRYDPSYSQYDRVDFYLTDDKKIGIKDEKGRISKIRPEEIPTYIASEISKTLR